MDNTPKCAVMQSIHPIHCASIASLTKTYEVRKSGPHMETPFKVYIYCTVGPGKFLYFPDGGSPEERSQFVMQKWEKDNIYLDVVRNATVIGEYICDEIIPTVMDEYCYDIDDIAMAGCRMAREEMAKYGGGKKLYLWHISDLKIYDQARSIAGFYRYNAVPGKGNTFLTEAPQSWCYVQDRQEDLYQLLAYNKDADTYDEIGRGGLLEMERSAKSFRIDLRYDRLRDGEGEPYDWMEIWNCQNDDFRKIVKPYDQHMKCC